MPPRSGTRGRVLRTAVELFRTQGYQATGLNQVLTAGSAPKGSLYFHFPGGKEQLAVEAVELAEAHVRERITAILATAPDAASGVESVIATLADDLTTSDFRRGCPVGTIAQTTMDNEPIRTACAAAFQSWSGIIEEFLVRHGIPGDTAPAIADTALAAIEGALLLAKSRKDIAPLLGVGAVLRGVLETKGR